MKQLIIFLAGIGVGATGCFLCVKKHYDKITDDEIKSVKEYYKKEFLEAFDNAHVYSSSSEDSEDNKVTQQNYKSKGSDLVNYSDFYKKEEETNEKNDKLLPYVIDEDEFLEENQYDKITISYFEDDSVFVNQEDDIISDGMEFVGEENISKFKNDVLYVRNEKLGVDYEVILEKGGYEDY